MHDCPYCGQACDCDGEDTWLDAPINCQCACKDYDGENDYDDYDDDYEDAYDDPCADCGPNCPDWGGDGICMYEIRQMAEDAQYEARAQHWYWRAWWTLRRAWWEMTSYARYKLSTPRRDKTQDDELPF